MTMCVPVRDMSGKQVGELELSDAIFAAPVNTSVMHQALVRQLSNARLGTHETKTRGEVRGGGKKPWRQKGTGRARQGSTRAPNWVGGGTVFGPTPRKYIKALPKKMQRAGPALCLVVKAAAGSDRRGRRAGHRCTQDQDGRQDAVRRWVSSDQTVLLVAAEKTVPVWNERQQHRRGETAAERLHQCA